MDLFILISMLTIYLHSSIFDSTGELCAMLACMPIWEELEAEGMTLNPLHTHLFFFCAVAFLGKDIR